MVNKSKRDTAILLSKVRDMLEKGYSEETIIDTLKIGRSTFYKYQNKVIKEIVKSYQPKPNEIEAQYCMLKKSLEHCYRINLQLSIDQRVSAHERTAATEMAAVARGQLLQLAREGYVQPQLPDNINGKVIPVNGKEVKA